MQSAPSYSKMKLFVFLYSDYGYARDATTDKCVRNRTISLMICKNGEEELESPSKG